MPTKKATMDPQAIQRIARLDLRARFIIEGLLAGSHRSPFHGFSVEFSEHRKYVPGDEISTIDWSVYGRTDRYFVKKYQAETNAQCHILMDTSNSMQYASNGVSKLEYATSIAAALGYLMIRQSDPVGLITFDRNIRKVIPPKSRRNHLFAILKSLSTTEPKGTTHLGRSLRQMAGLIRKRSIIIVLSDFLDEPERILSPVNYFRFRKHDIILFQILDHAERTFPFQNLSTFQDLETGDRMLLDPAVLQKEYCALLEKHNETIRRGASDARAEYVLMDTQTPFDVALMAYLSMRCRRK